MMPYPSNQDHAPIRECCYNAARKRYGDEVPEAVASRLEEELQHILRNGFTEPYMIAARIVDKAAADGYMMAMRGSVGSSFVAYLLGITEINPLPPHYRCQECSRIEWAGDDVASGFDLPNLLCSACGGEFVGDGHRIPYQMFLGVDGNTPPNIDLYAAWEYEEHAKNELEFHMSNRVWKRTIPVPDIIPHNDESIMKRLHALTGVNPRSIPMNDRAVLSLFRSTDALNVTPEQIMSETGTYGIPEMGIGCVRDMLRLTQPASFSDLVQISGLSHGSGTWEGNARERIQAGTGTLRTSLACRDQLMMELIQYGMDSESAYAVTASKRKDLPVSESIEAMLQSKVPAWYLESYRKIEYLFPKWFAVSYVISAVRNAFYKLHYPLEFYAAYFSVYSVHNDDADMELCTQEGDAIRKSLEEIQHEGYHPLLELALEMNSRGLRVKKAPSSTGDRYRIESDAYGSLEIPFMPNQQGSRLISRE